MNKYLKRLADFLSLPRAKKNKVLAIQKESQKITNELFALRSRLKDKAVQYQERCEYKARKRRRRMQKLARRANRAA